MNPEIEKTKLIIEAQEKEHQRKMDRETQRHDNIMEEIKLMAKHKITELNRREI